jgi:hypothetical protein
MRKIFTFLLFIALVNNGIGQSSWKKEGLKLPYSVCYGSNESHPSRIGPPKEYYDRLKSASTPKATIKVTYIGFPPDAQEAFQYAVDIWETLIYSPVTIRVQATWESLQKSELGHCSPANFYKNFNSTEKQDCYYPISLVEKMLREDMKATDEYDITASFNKDFSNWYFGTDGNTPALQYDFVSTVLHEMAHGLGFSGFFSSQNGSGGYGSDGSAIFDQFIIDKNGNKLVNSTIYPNPSTKLNLAMTSGWLQFNTQLVGSNLPRLFAPSTWQSGSSIYHLDDSSYPVGDPNSLMTPYTDMGESNHNPGPMVLAIMDEIGWKTISIKHTPLKDIEFTSTPITFNAEIVSDFGLDSSKVFLVYSVNKFAMADSIPLKASDLSGNFSAQLSNLKNGEFDYFFSATDIKNRRFVYPSGAPSKYLSFRIGIDRDLPVVTHYPVKFMLSTYLSSHITVEVTDNIGVKTVTVEYFVNGGLINQIELLNDSTDRYSGNLTFPAGSLKDGDVVSYRIVAVDVSSKSNIGKSPLTGYYTFNIGGIQGPVEKYVNNFNTDTHDFIGPDFNVSTPVGFDSSGLNSPHPYPSPDTDNTNFNLITVLKYPIILKDGGKMSFDEIVLVEPGEAGTKFGSPNFFDYVIVEGSKDAGKTWKPLIDGYDSRAQVAWAKLFNGSMSGNNSTAVATKDLFVKHEFGLLDNGKFNIGDTLQIRFRLFSDPYSHGWGWIIDNLSIQDVGTEVNSFAISSGELIFFPNPASGKLNLQLQSKNKVEKMNLKAYNSSGIMVYNRQYTVGSNSFQTEIDVQNFSPGLYLFTVGPENGKPVTRKIIIR